MLMMIESIKGRIDVKSDVTPRWVLDTMRVNVRVKHPASPAHDIIGN